ncbi:P-loop containing nucleoside triphosphate hydrolase protein [Annulohypoxylon maeteangense]|uniref:P-loop containing nucleoside triphosphate hydrolase protein n=1 Tax=Annulohypoxylon maeteangense TaxID=1927788 RepID=UPI0020086327|nr:P-loop containing nucleoside triphosphate hydrolase protein [Annulohypoxylon maeteangense]KAI0887436.1 P-loop containing nucleoside triphosphate hydrolase protein [Annulohypoxylon maeteangense]
MSDKPVFLATHPRACSTAFERIFMTRRDVLQCAHEPFGDSFYYGPERLSERYANDEAGRESSGFSKTTYRDVLNRLERDGSEGKRVFIKDMAYYLMPPNGAPPTIVPSLKKSDDYAEKGNPTVVPLDILKKFHWTFLIRHPRRGIPSYYRCCVPPLDEVTGFKEFMPNEAGYVELRRLFDYLREQKMVGPCMAGESNGNSDGEITITVIDADDLLDHPGPVAKAFCKETGIEYKPEMLTWDDSDNQQYVSQAFEKWNGFHNDAIHSKSLTARTQAHKTVTEESENEEWRQKFGDEAQKVIRACVDENVPHYEYLKSFALKF